MPSEGDSSGADASTEPDHRALITPLAVGPPALPIPPEALGVTPEHTESCPARHPLRRQPTFSDPLTDTRRRNTQHPGHGSLGQRVPFGRRLALPRGHCVIPEEAA